MKPNEDLALLYFGAFAPDTPEYRNAGSSTAGNLFQLSFLTALAKSGLPKPTLYSYFPVASFPHVRRLLFGSETARLGNGLSVRSIPHFNFGPLKILALGFFSFWLACLWGWRNRRSTHRVVLCYNLTAPPALPISVACKLLRMELVPFIGDIYVPGEVVRDTLLRRIEFRTQTRLIPKADGLLVANRAIVHDFAPGRESLLVEGGVMEEFIRRFEKRPRKVDGAFHVVFAGQLSVLNGVTMLLEAARLLDMPELRISILGGGEYASEVRKAVAQDPRLSYLGLVDHGRVLETYEQADLLVNLRRTDYRTHRYVFPSKVVECLATGRPLLTTRTGHVTEEFGDFVFTLEEESAEALAEAISRIAAMDPSSREKVGARARQYVRDNKTWEVHVGRLKTYLDEQVLSKRAA
ncbi:MAG TPA: glycosyltransferase [Fimbriimonadaceae bacterium]|nr:glycosyltransferase [Fimbriimonadaceae bacterium]